MFNMIFENKKGDQLHFGAGTPYTIIDFQGLNPPDATINTSTTALMDGGLFNSSKLNMRSMNIAFAIEENAEENRLSAYKVIQNKMPIRVYFTSDMLDIFIDGYVESCSPAYWSKKNVITVGILCPAPYFKGAQEMINEFSALTSMFHFPFASTAEPELVMGSIDTQTTTDVVNNGSAPCGLTFELYARRNLTNPKIINFYTREFLELKMQMLAGDVVTITTGQGNKSITLLRDAITTNIFNYLNMDSTWLQADVGENYFVYEVGEGSETDLIITIRHYDLYEGV